ncbi:MAG: dihydrolipoamide acetyltransferase family protein [Syntrophobacteraceae bacterium]|jgi:pyruvate dehydrogenase E2 component (dihydrolipoamide acetyltransferase)
MPVEFKLPDLGEGIHEGEIIEVLVHIGDRVEDGQTVLIVETDKATAEVPSPVTGIVKEIRVKSGQTVRVGEVLIVFIKEGEGEERAKAPPPITPQEKRETPPPEEKGKKAEALAGKTEEASIKTEAAKAPARPLEGPVPAAPSTRRLARELGIDINQVKPSGPGRRVTPEDVRAYAEGARRPEAKEALPEAEEKKPPAPPEAAALPQFDQIGPVERIPLRSVRRTIAKHLAVAWSQIPHVTHADVADLTELEAFRRKHKQQVADQGGALTLTVFAMKAAAAALKKFPRFNSSLDMESEEIIIKHYHNIGFAVDTERGLLVSVVRDVDCKSIFDLAIELKALAEKTRQGKATKDDMSGGTFTITNIGSIGGTGFSPIINYPEVAIMGMAQARFQPVVVGDEKKHEIVPRLMMPLNITIDHRVLDGAEAARFLNMIIEGLENPENLLMMS